ncbi:MAG: hypothetical protein ACRDTF_00010 [Pseudonocardiaceae bacterium]
MPAGDDIETRLAVVEHEVARLRERVARTDAVAGSAHVLAAGADREISESRAERRSHTQVLNALRETQLEHGAAISTLRQDVDSLRRNVDGLQREVREGFTEMREGFAVLGTGMAQITALLTNLGGSEGDAGQPALLDIRRAATTRRFQFSEGSVG